MKSLKQIIKNKLKQTKDCEFKKAFIPKGYACVKIDNFSKELAEIIEIEYDKSADEIIKLVRLKGGKSEKKKK